MDPVTGGTDKEPAVPQTEEDENNTRLLETMGALEAKNRELEEALKSRRRMHTIALVLALVLCAGLVLYFWFSTPVGPVARQAVSRITQPKKNAVKGVQTVTVQTEALSNAISLSGKLEPLEEVMVVCPFGSKVTGKNYSFGQRVERGDTLLKLSTRELESKIRDARVKFIKARAEYEKLKDWAKSAEMAKARRGLDQAQHDLARAQSKVKDQKELFKEGIISKNELEQDEEDVRTKKAALKSAGEELESVREKGSRDNKKIASMEMENAKQQMEELEEQLGKSEIKAPVDGIVIKPTQGDGKQAKIVEVNAPAAEGDILLAVANLEGMIVQTVVDEVDVRKVTVGQPVKVTGDAFSDVTLDGHIKHISAQAKPGDTRSAPSFEVVIKIDELPDPVQDVIKLGMSANLRVIVYENPKALTLPISAVRSEGDKRVVDVVRDGSAKPETVVVTTGLTTLDSVEITAGLSPGDKVVMPSGGAR